MFYFDMLKCRETCTYYIDKPPPPTYIIIRYWSNPAGCYNIMTMAHTLTHSPTLIHITCISHTHTQNTHNPTLAHKQTHTLSYQQTRTLQHTHTYDNDSFTYIRWGSNPMRGSCQLLTKGYWFTPRNMVEQWSKSSIHPTSFIYKKQSPNANVCMYMYMYVCKTDRTEMIRDNLNPDFVKKVILNCYFEESQRLKIEV